MDRVRPPRGVQTRAFCQAADEHAVRPPQPTLRRMDAPRGLVEWTCLGVLSNGITQRLIVRPEDRDGQHTALPTRFVRVAVSQSDMTTRAAAE